MAVPSGAQLTRVRAVRHWLEADGNRCLLVFDDAEDLGLLQPFVPATGAARVLITTAQEPVTELGTGVPVDVFSAEEALALLDGRTGLADEAGASAVAAELGHLPLALDQAAAVIAGQHLGYAAYLAKLRALPLADYLATGGGRGRRAVPAGRGGGGAAVPGGRPGCRPARRVHRSHGGHGHAVAGRGPLRPAACRRAGGHAARRRAPGGRVHGGPGAGAAERTVTAGFQSGRPGRQRALPGGAGGPRKAGPAGALRDGVPGGRRGPGNVCRGTREASGSGGGQGNARPGHGAAGKRGGARG